jgi:AcrR family transcriptional regulator
MTLLQCDTNPVSNQTQEAIMRPMTKQPQPVHGRKRLIDAALNLSYHKRSFSSLGIREIAREAGLSAPAFYRHFGDLADLGTAVIQEVEDSVLAAFRDVRKSTEAEDELDIRPMLIRRFFEWAAENPKHIVVGASEAFGSLEKMRAGLKSTIMNVAKDIVTDRRISALLPELPENHLNELMYTIAQNIFFMAVDYVEQPDNREAIFDRASRTVDVIFLGAHALTELAQEVSQESK